VVEGRGDQPLREARGAAGTLRPMRPKEWGQVRKVT
jgi:hypothetical protein